MANLDSRLLELFRQYAEDHRHPMNRLTHKIAIPLIVFHIVVMLNWVQLFQLPGFGEFHVTAAHFFLVFIYGYYFSLNRKLTFYMFLLTIPILFVGDMFSTFLVVILAVIGWGVQLAGHYIWEKNSPSFTSNMVQTIIGPFFFIAVLTGTYVPDRSLNQPAASPNAG